MSRDKKNMPPSSKQINLIAMILCNNLRKSKTIEIIYNELCEQLGDTTFTNWFTRFCRVCDLLSKKITTMQDASYIISCLQNNYSHSSQKLVAKFRELGIIETEKEFILDKKAMAINYN